MFTPGARPPLTAGKLGGGNWRISIPDKAFGGDRRDSERAALGWAHQTQNGAQGLYHVQRTMRCTVVGGTPVDGGQFGDGTQAAPWGQGDAGPRR